MNVYDFYITPEEYNIAKKNGISANCLNQRIRLYGWNKKKAITMSPQSQKDHGDWLNVARSNGITKQTFYSRIHKYGWSEEKAATEPTQKPTGRKFKYGKEVYERALSNGINIKTLHCRVRRGWALERACTEKLLNPKEIAEHLIQWDKDHNNYFRKFHYGYELIEHFNQKNKNLPRANF